TPQPSRGFSGVWEKSSEVRGEEAPGDPVVRSLRRGPPQGHRAAGLANWRWSRPPVARAQPIGVQAGLGRQVVGQGATAGACVWSRRGRAGTPRDSLQVPPAVAGSLGAAAEKPRHPPFQHTPARFSALPGPDQTRARGSQACSPPPPPLACLALAASQPHPRRPEQSGGRLEPEVSAAQAGGGGGLDPGSAGGGDAPGTRLFVSPSPFAGSGASAPPSRCPHLSGRPGEGAGGWQRDSAVSARSPHLKPVASLFLDSRGLGLCGAEGCGMDKRDKARAGATARTPASRPPGLPTPRPLGSPRPPPPVTSAALRVLGAAGAVGRGPLAERAGGVRAAVVPETASRVGPTRSAGTGPRSAASRPPVAGRGERPPAKTPSPASISSLGRSSGTARVGPLGQKGVRPQAEEAAARGKAPEAPRRSALSAAARRDSSGPPPGTSSPAISRRSRAAGAEVGLPRAAPSARPRPPNEAPKKSVGSAPERSTAERSPAARRRPSAGGSLQRPASRPPSSNATSLPSPARSGASPAGTPRAPGHSSQSKSKGQQVLRPPQATPPRRSSAPGLRPSPPSSIHLPPGLPAHPAPPPLTTATRLPDTLPPSPPATPPSSTLPCPLTTPLTLAPPPSATLPLQTLPSPPATPPLQAPPTHLGASFPDLPASPSATFLVPLSPSVSPSSQNMTPTHSPPVLPPLPTPRSPLATPIPPSFSALTTPLQLASPLLPPPPLQTTPSALATPPTQDPLATSPSQASPSLTSLSLQGPLCSPSAFPSLPLQAPPSPFATPPQQPPPLTTPPLQTPPPLATPLQVPPSPQTLLPTQTPPPRQAIPSSAEGPLQALPSLALLPLQVPPSPPPPLDPPLYPAPPFLALPPLQVPPSPPASPLQAPPSSMATAPPQAPHSLALPSVQSPPSPPASPPLQVPPLLMTSPPLQAPSLSPSARPPFPLTAPPSTGYALSPCLTHSAGPTFPGCVPSAVPSLSPCLPNSGGPPQPLTTPPPQAPPSPPHFPDSAGPSAPLTTPLRRPRNFPGHPLQASPSPLASPPLQAPRRPPTPGPDALVSGPRLTLALAPAPPPPSRSPSSTLSGPDLAGHSSSATSTPEELRGYDSGPEGGAAVSPPADAELAACHPASWSRSPAPPLAVRGTPGAPIPWSPAAGSGSAEGLCTIYEAEGPESAPPASSVLDPVHGPGAGGGKAAAAAAAAAAAGVVPRGAKSARLGELPLGTLQASVVQHLLSRTLLLAAAEGAAGGGGGGDPGGLGGGGVGGGARTALSDAELGRWAELLSPLDESRASITSVTSFSPDDVASPQGDWTVVEVETFH
ncbi:hypothetical protein MC885_004215, partial [Smutsia gigantea]